MQILIFILKLTQQFSSGKDLYPRHIHGASFGLLYNYAAEL